MGVPINNVTRRVVYAASGTGPYAFTFEILAAGDIAVYRDDTLLTITTNYTVTIAANGTGSITLTAAPTGATQIAIVGNRTISRTTDFVTGGDFFANTLNDELDQQTIFAQQNAEGLIRALSAPQTDPTNINMTLPRSTSRANKILGFDANGNPTLADTIGTNRGNWAAGIAYNLNDIVKDTTTSNIWQVLIAHTSTGALPISTNVDAAKFMLVVDAAAAGASATAAANSATASANSATAAANSASSAATQASNALASANSSAASALSAVNAPGTNGLSTTSLSIAIESKTFTIQTGKAFSIGQFVIIARTSSPSNFMSGQITSFNSSTGQMIVNVTQTNGSGTYDDWTVSLTAVSGASGGSVSLGRLLFFSEF